MKKAKELLGAAVVGTALLASPEAKAQGNFEMTLSGPMNSHIYPAGIWNGVNLVDWQTTATFHYVIPGVSYDTPITSTETHWQGSLTATLSDGVNSYSQNFENVDIASQMKSDDFADISISTAETSINIHSVGYDGPSLFPTFGALGGLANQAGFYWIIDRNPGYLLGPGFYGAIDYSIVPEPSPIGLLGLGASLLLCRRKGQPEVATV